MTTEQFTTTVLTASEGMTLTQAAEVEISKRVLGKTVALGRNDSAENWREITQEEADAFRRAQEEASKAAVNA